MPIVLEDVLSSYVEPITFKGAEHKVRAISATGIQLAQRIQSDNPPTFDELFAFARKLCPSLPDEAWADLDGELVGFVIAHSQTRLRRVETDLKNSSGPATTSPAGESGTNESPAG